MHAITTETANPIHPAWQNQKHDGGENSWPLAKIAAADEQATCQAAPRPIRRSGIAAGLPTVRNSPELHVFNRRLPTLAVS